MTGGVPDYHDPYTDAQRLLSSPKRRDREKGEHMLRLLESQANRQRGEQEFSERQADRRSVEEGRRADAQQKQEQTALYREQLTADRESRGEDRRAAMLNQILADPTADPAVKQAVQNHLLSQAGVSATLPADPKMVALARSKGLPEPQGTTVGAQPQPQATGNVVESNLDNFNRDFNYPRLPNTPEQRTLGAAPLAGSRFLGVDNQNHAGYQTPSGGFIGVNAPRNAEGNETADARVVGLRENLFGKEGTAPIMQANAGDQVAFRGHGGGSSFEEPGTGVAAARQYGQGVSTGQGETSPNLASINEKAGQAAKSIRNYTDPFTMAKNAVGGLFGGGQGGVNQLVSKPLENTFATGQPSAAPTPQGTPATGPITKAVEFAQLPVQPGPTPAGTPPAVPPINQPRRPSPEEERRMQLVGGY